MQEKLNQKANILNIEYISISVRVEIMNKEIIYSKNAPAAIGPYAQGVKVGNLLFISGQLPINPKTGELLTGDIQAQTKQVIENLKAIIEEAGATFRRCSKNNRLSKGYE